MRQTSPEHAKLPGVVTIEGAPYYDTPRFYLRADVEKAQELWESLGSTDQERAERYFQERYTSWQDRTREMRKFQQFVEANQHRKVNPIYLFLLQDAPSANELFFGRGVTQIFNVVENFKRRGTWNVADLKFEGKHVREEGTLKDSLLERAQRMLQRTKLFIFGLTREDFERYIQALQASDWSTPEGYNSFAQYHNEFVQGLVEKCGGENYLSRYHPSRAPWPFVQLPLAN